MSTYIIRKNNVITMNRGDSLVKPISIYVGKFPSHEKLTIDSDDIIYFAVMEPNQHFECAVVKQEYSIEDFDDNGDLVLNLDPFQTIGLKSGKYYYEIKLLKASDSSIHTLIPKTAFNILD